MSKEKKMKRNKMGNLLSIAGDDAEEIKQFIDSFLSQDSESDDLEEKCVDFCKIIAVADSEDEEEYLREWGSETKCLEYFCYLRRRRTTACNRAFDIF